MQVRGRSACNIWYYYFAERKKEGKNTQHYDDVVILKDLNDESTCYL